MITTDQIAKALRCINSMVDARPAPCGAHCPSYIDEPDIYNGHVLDEHQCNCDKIMDDAAARLTELQKTLDKSEGKKCVH